MYAFVISMFEWEYENFLQKQNEQNKNAWIETWLKCLLHIPLLNHSHFIRERINAHWASLNNNFLKSYFKWCVISYRSGCRHFQIGK